MTRSIVGDDRLTDSFALTTRMPPSGRVPSISRHVSGPIRISRSCGYLCADGKYVVIGGNGDSIFKRLMVAAAHWLIQLTSAPRLVMPSTLSYTIPALASWPLA